MTSTTKERPILFNAPMVRAILEGRKTVTRRVVKPQYTEGPWSVRSAENPRHERHSHDWWLPTGTQPYTALPHCPYGGPGDRLWVRETTEIDEQTTDSAVLSRYAADGAPVLYSNSSDPAYNGTAAHWDYPRPSRPSIHMHRWASRILLEITDVRVERLQDISEDQALAEGIIPHVRGGWHWHPHDPSNVDDWHQFGFKSAAYAFQDLWIGTGGNWDANPWVWVVEFKRVTP
ncbi:hypothetical protein NPS46_25095 [Pseudomonas putida]|uniref:hypothetical protein n=1 Tax=Pseudomonas putida TaxID=303 RepID=UPI0023648986|nr:hypothetical protein [Pseudomonas putida]MDD2055830.1 hypothetical protein [Pseudomonas putida]